MLRNVYIVSVKKLMLAAPTLPAPFMFVYLTQPNPRHEQDSCSQHSFSVLLAASKWFSSVGRGRESLLKGKAQCGWSPCSNQFISTAFVLQTLFTFYKASYFNEELNCTRPFHSVSVPWAGSWWTGIRGSGLLFTVPFPCLVPFYRLTGLDARGLGSELEKNRFTKRPLKSKYDIENLYLITINIFHNFLTINNGTGGIFT